jgi:hypothetical protein
VTHKTVGGKIKSFLILIISVVDSNPNPNRERTRRIWPDPNLNSKKSSDSNMDSIPDTVIKIEIFQKNQSLNP